MLVHGREVDFLLSVGASAEISEMCPEGDLNRIGELFESNSYGNQVMNIAKIISALSNGYEQSRKYEDKAYVPNPLTVDEIMSLTTSEMKKVEACALAKFNADSQTTVEVENTKKEETAID